MSLNTNDYRCDDGDDEGTKKLDGDVFARDFAELCGKGRLSELEEAWEYYVSMNALERFLVRNSVSMNGGFDFMRFIESLEGVCPDYGGTAGFVGKAMLIDDVNSELDYLSENERKSYLNGRKLEFKI